MADGRSTQQGGSQSSRPRRGLGNGLGSLIPDAPPTARTEGARPLDVLFPESTAAHSGRERGGSARELLQPRRGGRRNVSRETSTAAAVSAEREAAENAKAGVETSAEASSAPDSRETSAQESGRLTRRLAGATGKKSRTRASVSADRETTTEDASQGGVDSGVGAHADGDVSRETSSAQMSDAGANAVSTEAGKTSEKRRADRATTSDAKQQGRSAEMGRAATTAGGVTSAALDAIMGTSQNVSRETSEDAPELMAVPGASFAVLRIAEIIPNSRQPREVFDEDELSELAASITEVGVLQPIVVRPITAADEPTEALRALLEAKPEARYELIMGERRLRASELAGNLTVPAIIRDTDDDDLLRDALLENLHRVQLNPLEEASAYQQLMADFGATQEELAKRIARSRPQIANTLRLLKLPPAVQRKLAGGSISAGHARALLGLPDPADMERLAERIVAEGLSVRTTEELVRLGLPRHSGAPKQKREKTLSPLGEKLVSALSDAYDTRVTISEGRRKGKIVIEFAGSEDLERIASLLVKE